MDDAIVRLFVLIGFLFMALSFLTLDRRRWWGPGIAVLSFSIALILHIMGMVTSS